MPSNEEFFGGIRSLIDEWCDRRALRLLADLLPPYLAFNGMTDGWGELHRALRNIIALHCHDLSELEREKVHELIQVLERALDR